MIRDGLIKGLDHDPNFTWRGESVTRIENLSDIVFALALGMLISTGFPITSFSDLEKFLASIIPVSAGFAIMIFLWHQHFTFFRRYGVADQKIIFLNAVLLFVILYIAYPLRFAFESFYLFIVSSITGDYSEMTEKGLDSFDTSGVILCFFGIGYALVHLIYALMHQHVVKKREPLNLSETELQITKQSIFVNWLMVALSVVMSAVAFFSPLNGLAGFILSLSGFVHWIGGKRYKITDANTKTLSATSEPP